LVRYPKVGIVLTNGMLLRFFKLIVFHFICCLQVPCFRTCTSLLCVLGEGQWQETGKDGSYNFTTWNSSSWHAH